MPLQTTIHTSATYFATQYQEWHELFVEAKAPLFMHPAYQKIWWQYEGVGELQILEVREDTDLIGLLPLFLSEIDDQKVLRIIGAVDLSDYLGVITRESDREKVYPALLDQLRALEWDELRLESLHHSSPLLTELSALFPTNWQVKKNQQDVCPVIPLPKSFDEYLESLDAKQRKHFRRLRRDIGIEDEIEYHCETEPTAIKELMPKFIELHKASSTEKEAFWTPEREQLITEAMTELSKDKLVRLYCLTVNQDPAAALLLFDYQNEWLGYNSGFNAYRHGHMGVSNVIFLHAIEEAIKAGKSCFDFMRGSESYKMQFGAKPQPLYDLVVTKN